MENKGLCDYEKCDREKMLKNRDIYDVTGEKQEHIKVGIFLFLCSILLFVYISKYYLCLSLLPVVNSYSLH